MEQGLGIAHFFAQADGVGKAVLGLLLLLSLASWYLILTRLLANLRARRTAAACIASLRQTHSLADLRRLFAEQEQDHAFARLIERAVEAAQEGEDAGAAALALAGGMAEYLSRDLGSVIDREAAQVDVGLTILATAGSTAPYVGLFGTVWGIYQALVQIGMSGQGTLDKVAGPVGEALIMTALGLAVAIPAVLAYNAFTRRNRVWLSQLEAFAHDLYVLLTVRASRPAPAQR